MKKALVLAVLASALAPIAAADPVLTGYVAAATPTQEKTNPTISTGKTPSCVTTFRFVNKPVTAQKLEYRLRCFNITRVTMAHIHGPADADNTAGVLADLFTGPETPTGEDINGLLKSGVIERNTFPGGVAAFDLLIARMNTDQTYVNVHTNANGGGEVRGQIAGIVLPNNPGLMF